MKFIKYVPTYKTYAPINIKPGRGRGRGAGKGGDLCL